MSTLIDGLYYDAFSNGTCKVDQYPSISYSGDIIIPSSVSYNGISYSVTSIGDSAFNGCSNLISITIPSSITSIGSSAFGWCSKLTNVTLTDSIISIGDAGFYKCSSLTSITLSKNLTSIGDSAFNGCSSLISINIPKSVTNIGGHVFYGCTKLSNVIIPSSVTSIEEYAFRNCSLYSESFTGIIIPSGVTSIGTYAFNNCTHYLWIRVDCKESVFTAQSTNTSGRYRAEKDGYIYYVLTGHTVDELPTSNTPPTTPTFIIHNATVPKTLNDQVIVSWGQSTDAENNPLTYDLYFFDGKTWVAIKGNNSELTFTHSIPITSYNTTEAKYKVRAFDGALYSDFIESTTFEIYGGRALNTAPTINDGDNEDLGQLTSAPTITYSVDDIDIDDVLSVSISIDNDRINFISDVTRNQDYTLDLATIWDSLDTDLHTVTISVSDGELSSKRRYTFSKYVKINYLPTISGIDTNLGRQDFTFTQSYSVDDKDNSVNLTVIVKIDDTILNTISNAIRNNIYTIDLASVWDSLSVGLHRINITVTDNNSNSATRIYNFFKGNGNNHVPTIDGVDSYLGEKSKPFNQTFIINDSDINDKIQVTIYLDGNVIDQRYDITRGFEYIASINQELFNKLDDNSNHTIQIVASDGIAITTRSYIFTKKYILEDYMILDIKFNHILPILECKQDDDITLKFKIEDLGEDLDLTNYTVKFKAIKYNNGIYESTSIAKNSMGIITVHCNEELTDIIGKAKFQVQIFDTNNKQYSTQLVDLFIRKNCTLE